MSRVTGLVREIVMARLFGAGFVYDAFLLGFRIPNLTRDLFAEGALSSAFVPIFTQTLAQKGRKEAAILSNLVATALILIVGAFCVLGVIFSPALVNLLAEGFHQVPGKFELAVKHDAHHVPVPAAGGSGRAGHGRVQRLQPLRRARAGVHVLQHRLGRLRAGLRLPAGTVARNRADHRDGHRRSVRRRAATRLADCRRCGPRASASIPASTGIIPDCATSSA